MILSCFSSSIPLVFDIWVINMGWIAGTWSSNNDPSLITSKNIIEIVSSSSFKDSLYQSLLLSLSFCESCVFSFSLRRFVNHKWLARWGFSGKYFLILSFKNGTSYWYSSWWWAKTFKSLSIIDPPWQRYQNSWIISSFISILSSLSSISSIFLYCFLLIYKKNRVRF